MQRNAGPGQLCLCSWSFPFLTDSLWGSSSIAASCQQIPGDAGAIHQRCSPFSRGAAVLYALREVLDAERGNAVLRPSALCWAGCLEQPKRRLCWRGPAGCTQRLSDLFYRKLTSPKGWARLPGVGSGSRRGAGLVSGHAALLSDAGQVAQLPAVLQGRLWLHILWLLDRLQQLGSLQREKGACLLRSARCPESHSGALPGLPQDFVMWNLCTFFIYLLYYSFFLTK